MLPPQPPTLHPLFVSALARTCGVTTQHATTPLLASALLHNYTSHDEEDCLFGASHNPFATTWAGGASLLVCAHHPPSVDASLRWAIASAIRPAAPPTAIFILVPHSTSGQHCKWLGHPCVHVLAKLRRDFTHSMAAYAHSQADSLSPPPKRPGLRTTLLVVANASGRTSLLHTARLNYWWSLASNVQFPHVFHPGFREPAAGRRGNAMLFKPPLAMAALPTSPSCWRTAPPPWCVGLDHEEAALAGCREMRSLFPATANLRWDWASAVYTDGACIKGPVGNLLGAAVYLAASGVALIVDPAGENSTRTIMRAELAAIHGAITAASHTPTLHIFTDSLASLYLLRRAVCAPHSLLECKHMHLLTALATSLHARAARGLPTRLYKVKAHAGVRGNELADAAAGKGARGEASPDLFVGVPNESTMTLPCWPVASDPPGTADGMPCCIGGRHSPLANLTTAITSHIDTRHAVGSAKPTVTSGTRAAVHAVSVPGPSNHMWAGGLPSGIIRLALLVRYNMLHCSARASIMRLPYACTGPFPAIAGACPLCGAGWCSSGHILGACHHPAMKPLYVARHNKAVITLHASVAAGPKGGMLCVMMDACPTAALPDGILGTRLPPWLLPARSLPAMTCPLTAQPLCPASVRRKLRPDLLYVEGLSAADVASTPIPRRLRRRAVVHVVEVGYITETADSYQAGLARKRAQHDTLCAALRDAGWRIRGDGPTVLLLGNAGTVFCDWAPALSALGVAAEPALSLMRSLHTHSLRYAAAINKQRLTLEHSPG